MKANWLPLSAAVALALGSVAASAVDFNGYARTGMMFDQGHTAGQTLNKNKVGRLGNETDTYLEIALGQNVYDKGGVTMKLNTMNSYTATGSNDSENLNGGFRQLNVEVNNVFGGNETIWLGKRYNNRNDIHITDFYYWDVSGESIGVSGIDFGGAGKLGFSITRSDRAEGLNSRNYIADLRLVGTDLGFGSLDFGIDHAFVAQTEQERAGYDGTDGTMLTTQLTIPFESAVNGFNKTVIQWGTEGWSKAMAYYGGGNWYGAEAKRGAKGGRVINWGVLSISKLHLAHSVLWSRSIKGEETSLENFDAVIRPEFAWNQNHKTMLELGYGYTQTNDGAGESSAIQKKYTLSQAICAGSGFGSRPELRLFVSYLDTNDDNKFSHQDTSKKSSHTIEVGAQMEAWW